VEGLATGDDWVALAWAELPWTAGALAGGLAWPAGEEGCELAEAAVCRPRPETSL